MIEYSAEICETFVNFDGSLRETNVFCDESLLPAGDNSVVYQVTVTAVNRNPNAPVPTLPTTYNLTVRNPCTDAGYVTFPTPVQMPDFLQYTLSTLKPDGIEIDSVTLLEVLTSPNPTSLCQEGLYYTIVFNGEEVTETSLPMRWVINSMDEVSLRLYSEDFDLCGYNFLSVQAVLPYNPIRRRNLQAFTPSGFYPLPLPADPFDGNILAD